MEVFPDGWHFLPKHPEKNIKYYRQILIEEESARVENIMNKGDPSVVLYHKFIITGFFNCKDWGQHPSLLKTLKGLKSITNIDLHYSYHDYIDAFEKVLFYQNKKFDHSWFIMFDKKFHSQIPTWFLKWWEMFGAVPQIFPKPLQDVLREFSVKWWDSLKIDTIISQPFSRSEAFRRLRSFRIEAVGRYTMHCEGTLSQCEYPVVRSKVRSSYLEIKIAKMMSKLFRSNSTTSLASRTTSLPDIPQELGIINSEEYEMSDVNLKLGDWNLPKVPTKEFYKSSSWNLSSFKTDFHIRTIEKVFGTKKEYETCYLFSPALN
ncbi:hypothetical protein SO802_010925 [Lithocarpus litseifolius]|uniref:Uncharacterized protein n=1 Tax=Lithocarpus litseifolius TaxID=425828 RepID=A0AAW2DFK0_9ROSI